jgi:GNAT superfamily N-acetyltransferase
MVESEYEFLTGEEERRIEIDPIFAKDLARILREQEEAEPGSIDPPAADERTPCLTDPSLVFAQSPDGFLFLLDSENAVVAAVVGADMAVAETHRGRGLGTELLAEFYLRNECLPTWWTDEAAFSPGGHATARAAWRLLNRSTLDHAGRRERAIREFVDTSGAPGPR